MLENKIILLTGGTGSFGNAFAKEILENRNVKALRIYSRDELKHLEMKERFHDNPKLRFLIGDVRDKERLNRAMNDVDIVVHAAALKQVPSSEYNPFEVIKTNIIGSQNVIDAAIDNNVQKTLLISSDKATNPINLYGATKLCAEKLFVQSNFYAGSRNIHFSVCKYGNVIGSRGSVLPLFLKQAKTGVLTVTDRRMTRFWITMQQGVTFVLKCLEIMYGGEIFIPKIPSARTIDIAEAVAPGAEIKEVGIRPGEKLSEVLLTEDDARRTFEYNDFFIIAPQHHWWNSNKTGGKKLPEGFVYSSDNNEHFLTVDEIRDIVRNNMPLV